MPDLGFLRVTTPDGQTKDYQLDFQSAIVGRADGNRIVIPHVSISRRHALLTVHNGELLVEDFNSASGTYVDGKKLLPDERMAVRPGSLVRFGDAQATLVLPQPAVSPVSTDGPEIGASASTVFSPPPRGPSPSTAAEPAIPRFAAAPDVSPATAMAAQAESARRQFIGVTLSSPSGPVAPGAATAATVVLQNRGNVVDEFAVSIEGVAASWIELARGRTSLMPGARDELTIVIKPPATREATAGRHAFSVVVRSRQHGIDVRAVGAFEIGAVNLVRPAIRPVRGPGPFALSLANLGNSPAQLRLAGEDDEDKLQFSLPSDVTVPPGETLTVDVKVLPSKRMKVKTEMSAPFRLMVQSQDPAAMPMRVDGTVVMSPKKGGGVLRRLVITAVVLGAIFYGLKSFSDSCGSGGLCDDFESVVTGSE